MLTNLHVKNLALIEESEVSFGPGLNILTGETGAGKSIIIGSINYCLGEKIPNDVIREGAEYALVELVFVLDNERQIAAILDMDIPVEDGQVILTRKIMPGRSIFKICGETVTAKQMKAVAGVLIDIHGQHEHQSLLKSEKQAQLLDSFAATSIEADKEALGRDYKRYNQLTSEIESLSFDDSKRERELSLARYEVDEIEAAHLDEIDEQELHKRYELMKNSRVIVDNISRCRMFLTEDNANAADFVGYASRDMQSATELDERLIDVSDKLVSAENLIREASRDIQEYMDDFEFSDAEFAELEQKIDAINHLSLKYGESVEDILAYADKRRNDIETLSDLSGHVEKLKSERAKLEIDILTVCDKLHEERVKEAALLSDEITACLEELNFLKAEFIISVNKKDTFGASGYDEISFDISLNPGEKPKPVSQVASGGELSRIMLALKSVFARKDQIDTLIFDEIDAGISGRTAWKVSERMGVLSGERQIICITHLPQIAAMADSHFMIEKRETDGRTVTDIYKLKEDNCLNELARLLGSDDISGAALDNALELRKKALEVKKAK